MNTRTDWFNISTSFVILGGGAKKVFRLWVNGLKISDFPQKKEAEKFRKLHYPNARFF